MAQWNQDNLHKDMSVYSSEAKKLGHIAEIYQDSFLIHKGFFFKKDRYIPYSAIAKINDDGVQLTMSADEANQMEWKVRPDYENHPGDPTQLFYDRGHGVHDPFDESETGRS